ncbi:MAG TPA: PadR family transcriptional regulator [Candidatus Saccharimonadales bacterium]
MSKSPSEELLIESNIFNRRSPVRRQLLGYIGCRWNASRETGEDPSFHGYQALKCSSISPGSIYPILDRLEEAGVVVSQFEDMSEGFHGRPPRKTYHPARTELGLEFKDIVSEQSKQSCGIDPSSE